MSLVGLMELVTVFKSWIAYVWTNLGEFWDCLIGLSAEIKVTDIFYKENIVHNTNSKHFLWPQI